MQMLPSIYISKCQQEYFHIEGHSWSHRAGIYGGRLHPGPVQDWLFIGSVGLTVNSVKYMKTFHFPKGRGILTLLPADWGNNNERSGDA